MFTFHTDDFVVRPLKLVDANPGRAALKNSIILRRLAAQDSLFTDFTSGCNGKCDGYCQDLEPGCAVAQQIVATAITSPSAMVWEVFRKDDDLDFVGILRLGDIQPGCDATGHYFFFDHRLRDKTDLLKAWVDALFTTTESWPGLHRISISVPAHAFALAHHAQKFLNFGGPYVYRRNGRKFNVEGVKKDAILWRGNWHDVLLMGLTTREHNGQHL
jgi:RimJ/RimL family protein N-acetyltransferase